MLIFTIQVRQILRTNIDGEAIDGDGEWLFHYFDWPNPSDTTYFALKMDPAVHFPKCHFFGPYSIGYKKEHLFIYFGASSVPPPCVQYSNIHFLTVFNLFFI